MAWSLKKEDSGEEFKLLTCKEYRIGRVDSEIVLEKDPSISRKHAVIIIRYAENFLANVQQLPVVTIKDFSKYGTKVNDVKLDGGECVLKSGDTVTFGIVENVWRLVHTPFVCSSSGLETVEKSCTRQLLTRIGGHLLPEWTSDCNHLIANKLTVTIKVINALVSQCPIVIVDYLKSYVNVVEQRSGSLNVANFLPPIVDKNTYDENKVNFGADARRKDLFRGKTFIVWSEKQLKKMRFTVLSGGGEIQMKDPKCADGLDLTNLADRGLHVLKPANDDKLTTSLNSRLQKQGHRLILEGDIGLSVLYCSTEIFSEPAQGIDLDDFSIASSFASESQTPAMSLCYEQSQRLGNIEPKEPSKSLTSGQNKRPAGLTGGPDCNAKDDRHFKRPSEGVETSIKRIKTEVHTNSTNKTSEQTTSLNNEVLDSIAKSGRVTTDELPKSSSRTSSSCNIQFTSETKPSEKERKNILIDKSINDHKQKTARAVPDNSLPENTPFGFLSSRIQEDVVKMEEDENGERVFTNIKMQSLLENHRKKSKPSTTVIGSRAVKNFKKFQKVKIVKRVENGDIKMSSLWSRETARSIPAQTTQAVAADSDDSDTGNMFDF